MRKANKKFSLVVLSLVTIVAMMLGMFLTNPVQATTNNLPTDKVIWMENKASIRLDYDDGDVETDKTGIRFTVNVNKEMLEALTAVDGEYEGYTATLGAAIIPTKYLGTDAKPDASKMSYTYKGDEKSVMHVELVNKKEKVIYDESTGGKLFTHQTYNAVVTDIPAVNYTVQLSASGYIKLEKSGETTVYIQAETVAERSIADVVTAFLTDTSENGPTADEKRALNALVNNGVAPALANKLEDGYLADFSNENYKGLVKQLSTPRTTDGAPVTVEYYDSHAGETDGVLKVVSEMQGSDYNAFKIQLPKATIGTQLQIRMYIEYSNAMELCFGDPDNDTNSTSKRVGGKTEAWTHIQNAWETYTVDYTNCTNKDVIEVVMATAKPVTIYIAWVREVKEVTAPKGEYLADFSSYGYESIVEPMEFTWSRTVKIDNSQYIESHAGETGGVLKVDAKPSSSHDFRGVKINLPKSATGNKVLVRLYVETSLDAHLFFGNPDTEISGGDDYCGGSNIWDSSFKKNEWVTYVVDYSNVTNKGIVEIAGWSSTNQTDSITYYIAWVKQIDLVSGLEEGYLADFSSTHYEELVTNYAGNGATATYMSAGPNDESNVLKIDMVSGVGCWFGFKLELPVAVKKGQKIKIRFMDGCINNHGNLQFLNPITKANMMVETSSGKVEGWQEYTVDYSECEDTNQLIFYCNATGVDKNLTFYISWVMIAE